MLPIRYYADIEEVSVTLAGSDPMGKVSGGYIRISAYMKKNCTPVSWAVDRYPKRSPDHFDDRERPQGKAPPSGALHLILGYSEVSVCNQNKGESGTFKDATLSGLILEPTRENVDEYRRIGMFTHAWGPGRRNDPDHFPESVDFENEGFERHSVTII
ncbi:uncharacterized protein BDR25DRAFT_9249 [Lindgomyces ingoldianus]|uniref:Uncharacterized protein n=1 Tax=Lindgomyces ingoldianus TaxID=673940 RepID=A0ACB6RIT2_9PLEO|nr:uncharacterized protein BDR25DRAFT_9249 [Lindgomyces ingoldianus]KAF2478250.1 hypothetical protein BDR25DRAFT_9249 [Lindgomyces ingoldianus]